MRHHSNFSIVLIISAVIGATPNLSPGQALPWRTAAKWHRTLKKAEPGTLSLDTDSIEYRSAKFSRRWKYLDIHTFDLSQRELILLTYENRRWHEPGERPFRFTLSEPMPPEIAAQLSARVGKPVRNGAPLMSVTAIKDIAAHHRVWSGGSNGVLRLKVDGIDYVTEEGRDSRSWRWSDIQTLANPNPYELRVTAFREIAEFDLKQPLPREVFEKLWDRLYAAGLNLSPSHQEIHQ
ncbi:MAG TPA: hypothetical protein VJ731_14060 [Terriglobales bacterium]|nr:hypothetical protein [Terriglobales bacterium]